MINYNDFKKIVPKETEDFLDFVLPYLYYYSKEEKELLFQKMGAVSKNYYSKYCFLLLFAMAQNKEYEAHLSKYGFDKGQVRIVEDNYLSSKSPEDLFTSIGSIIPDFKDITMYEMLTPIDIFLPILEKYWEICEHTVFKEMLNESTNFSEFKQGLIEYNNRIKAEQERELEKDLYGNLPINVISYLETASKIRTLLLNKLNNNQKDFFRKTEEDIIPLSLILAIYYYKDTPRYIEEGISEQEAIKDFLSLKGINQDKIVQNLSISLNIKEVAETPKNMIAIKNFYQRYCTEGNCQDKEQNMLAVSNILTNVFNREFTSSIAAERLLAKMNCYIGLFHQFDESIQSHMETQKRIYSTNYVKNFYENLSKEVREFVDFTAKTYILLLEKMKSNTHNAKLLYGEDDADTLALFIATYYFNGDVSEFFMDYGITLEKVLKLLNITITQKEIEEVELNQKVLVDRYKRFVYEGVNRNTSAKNLTINHIAHNLCNRDFNRSMIMESIFSELIEEPELKSDFLEQLKNHLAEKEQTRKRKLTERLFRDIPVNTIEILENTSRIHTHLEEKLKNWSLEDIKSIALLLGILLSPDNEVKKYLKNLGFTVEKICSYLGINNNSLLNNEINIDILSKEYGNYIFGGKSKNKKREEISPLELAKNIFVKERNNSVTLSKFLAYFHQSYETYAAFDENYQNYLETTAQKKRQEEAKSMIASYNDNTYRYLRAVFEIYDKIRNQKEENHTQLLLITNEDDVKEASMILGLFIYDNNSRKFFEKHGLTLEEILQICKLDSSTTKTSIYSDSNNYLEKNAIYNSYLVKDSSNYRQRRTIDDFARRIFDNDINQSMFLENLAAKVGANYDILKEEVESGKDYELSLTVDDRISLLSKTGIDTLDLEDIKSVLHFGNSLSIHSKYIHDELPKLMLSDVHKESIDTINQIIGRVCEKKVPSKSEKRGWLKRLFAVSNEEKQTPEYVLNSDAIKELKDAIDTNIKTLSKEVLGYDAIRRYIEVYRRKNRTHYIVANDMVSKIQEELQGLDPHKDEEYEKFLTASSRLQIMRDKQNRFATTNQLMQQELIKVNQAIVNHFITINALETARDDLLPLVGSELALNQGRSTENQSLELSQNVMQLFQSLLERNVDNAVANMEQLRRSNLSSGVFESLTRDIEVYLQGLNQINHIEEKEKYLDMNHKDKITFDTLQTMEDTDQIELTLTGDNPKQKTIGTMPFNN